MMKGESALGRQKMLKKNKQLQGSLDSGLLPEGHFLAARIGRTVYFLDFSDLLIKKCVFEFIIFLKARCSPGPRLGGAFYLSIFPNFEKKTQFEKVTCGRKRFGVQERHLTQ